MATGTGLLPEKVLADIQECISKLGDDFGFTRIPINDDNTYLHRFCSKLEFLLQNGMKEYGTLLRKRRDYWDYFCHCLPSSHGNIHDGLKFVKSHPELKTSLARGRAFIRFCLVRQCLADTLQCCLVNEKVTSTYYYERSVLRQTSQLSLLLSSLYELNDIQFDLSPRGYDLDVSWPTFARKLFDSSHLWQPPSRSVSISSLSSYISQNDSATAQHSNNTSSIKEIEELRAEIERIENNMVELQQKLQRTEQQEEFSRHCADEKEQQLIHLTEQLETERNSHKTDICKLEENTVKLQKEWQKEKNHLTENMNTCVETSKEHTAKLNQMSLKYEHKERDFRELQEKIINLQQENSNVSSQSMQLERDLKLHQEHLDVQKTRANELETIVLKLKDENKALKNQIKEELADAQMQSNTDAVQSCKKLSAKLETAEAENLISVTAEKEELNKSVHKLQHINSILEQLVNTMERENSKLHEQITIIENNMAGAQTDLETCKAEKTDLENQISEVRTELDAVINNNDKIKKELKVAKKFPIELILAMEKIMHSLNSDSSEIVKRLCSSHFVDDTLREKISSFVGLLAQISSEETVKSAFSIAHQSLSACSSPLYNAQDKTSDIYKKETMVINEMQKELNCCLQEALKLSCQMCVLKDTLHLDYDKDNISPLSDSDLVENNVEISDCDNSADGIPHSILSVGSTSTSFDETHNNVSKLNKLTAKAQKLCHNLEAFRHLNHCLIAKVQEQERKLSGIAQELEAIQKLVASLKLEHNKLQTSEAITRYELKEKRKLLTRLRTQLESTREDWHRMRKSYCDSEAEWQSLRDEFAKRHKQASEESGFIDCSKNFEENETVEGGIEIPAVSSPIDISESSPRDDSMMTDCSVQLSSSCEGAEGGKIEESNECVMPKTRLELLEEQCQSLYQSLVNNATRRGHLEERVQSLYTSTYSNRTVPAAVHSAVSLQQTPSVSLRPEHIATDNNLNDSDNILLDTMIQNSSLPLNDSLLSNELEEIPGETADDVVEQSVEENEDGELHLSGAGDYSDLNSSTDDEDSHAQEESEEELHYLRRQALHGFVKRFLSERGRHESQEADLNLKVETLQKANLKLEKEVENLKQERNDLLAKDADFRKRTEYIFRQERECFSRQLQEFEMERSQRHKNFDRLTLELKEATDKVHLLEESLHKTMGELRIVQQLKDDEVATLQFQHGTESLKYERALKHFTEQEAGIAIMRKKVSDQEYQILTLRESLQLIKEEREQHWHELDELQLSLSTRDEECTKMNEDLKKVVIELDQEKKLSNQLQVEIREAKEQSENMMTQYTSELSDVKSDNVELKKNLVKLVREKDKLWKQSEKLSHQQKIQVTDRWMEDSEANNCLGCRITFSFTIRKHHCRLCGRIFCHSCSNNWLSIASSRSQARICNECFLQHSELQTEVEKTDLYTNLAEDSEDDCEAAAAPTACSIAHSPSQLALSPSNNIDPENHSSMADNTSTTSFLVSSPETSAVLESASLPMYGSVPDLPSFCASRRCSHDNLVQVTNQRMISNTLESASKKTVNQNPFADFDVISDEEIAHSLSSYNPYIQRVKTGRKTDSRLHTTITRTAAEIAAAGINGVKGELWVNAGTQYGVPVVCDEAAVLHWEFSTEPQRIAFSVAYKLKSSKYDKFEMQPLLHTTYVNSSQHCVKGHVVMKKAGVYVLLFDNRFSRISAKKVKYSLLVNSVEECVSNNCKENMDHE